MLREHLEYLRDTGHALPGDPRVVAAAMGGMLSMLAYALLPADHGAPSGREPGYPETQILDAVSTLLLYGLTGRAERKAGGTGWPAA